MNEPDYVEDRHEPRCSAPPGGPRHLLVSRKTSKPIAEEEVPKFSMTSRKVKGADLAEEGEDG